MYNANRVKELREKIGMTQEELAQKLGYKSKSSVAHIENGRDVPRGMVTKLAKILNTTPAYLMGWEEEEAQYKVGDSPAIILPNSPYKTGDSASILLPNPQYKISGAVPKSNVPGKLQNDGTVKAEVCGLEKSPSTVITAEVRHAEKPSTETKQIAHYMGVGKTHLTGVTALKRLQKTIRAEAESDDREKYIVQAVKKLKSMSEDDLKDMFTIMEFLEFRKEHSEK